MSTDAARTGVSSAPLFETHGVVGVGYEGSTIDGFLTKVKEEQVSLLVDVRLDPVSRKPGFSEPFSSCFFELKNEHGSGDLSSPLRAAPQPT